MCSFLRVSASDPARQYVFRMQEHRSSAPEAIGRALSRFREGRWPPIADKIDGCRRDTHGQMLLFYRCPVPGTNVASVNRAHDAK